MAVIVETLDASGALVEMPDASGPSPDPTPSAAPLPEAPGDSAPPPDSVSAAPADPASTPAAPAPAPVTDSEDTDQETRDVPRSVQRRFDTLTRQREEARREAQALQQRYDRELAELRGQVELQTRLLRGEQPPAETLPLAQQPQPKAEDFASDHEWFQAVLDWKEAQTLWKVEQRQHQQAAQAEEQRLRHAMATREATLRQSHADYDAQISTLGAKGLTPQVYQALLQHELGPDLGYYLAQHPDELQRLGPMGPLQVWRELGKLEARLEGNGSAPPQSPSVVSSSPKPAPLTPLGSSGGGAPVPALDDPNVSQRDWEREAERQYPGIFGRRR